MSLIATRRKRFAYVSCYPASVADWLGCQLARWQVGPLNRRQFGPPRKCGREAKKNSFSKTHKQNSPLPQGPCFGVRHPFLGMYRRRNSTSQSAGSRIPARRNGVLSTSFELQIIYRCFTSKPSGQGNRVSLL
ncbi:hypothetical protein AVEN_105904-1 [Araneus ventricosus]|uniref:Uncharacterized protein n=1 Tax=Araneus ventricosus TaxID=182803 RepID=A0A4Y2P6H4_ARAVE|nr:hypothetical protein AVEN_105904-1 [Araneus ventricosus]